MGIQRLGGGSSVWEEKTWEMLAETAALLADRANMAHGAAEPFVDAGDVTLVNATVSGGYCANTQGVSGYVDETSGATFTSSSPIEAGYPLSNLNSGTNIVSFDTGTPDLRITFATAKVITRYYVRGGGLSYPAGNWTLYGSTDNSSWVTLDTRSAQSTSSGVYYTFANTTAYRYYRMVGANSVRFQLAYLQFYSATYVANLATVTLNPISVSGATAGKIVFRASNQDATAILDVVNDLGVYPMIGGSQGAQLEFTSEDLGSNNYRFTSKDFSLTDGTFGARFASLQARNFRIYDTYIIWR